MSGSFSDLPKYPGEARDERAELLNQLRSDTPAGPPDSLWNRLRHAFPAVVLVGLLAFGLFIAVGMGIILALKAVDAGLASSLVLLAAFVALPAVAIGAAVYQRHRNRQGRGWS
jgi:hypothetical protein